MWPRAAWAAPRRGRPRTTISQPRWYSNDEHSSWDGLQLVTHYNYACAHAEISTIPHIGLYLEVGSICRTSWFLTESNLRAVVVMNVYPDQAARFHSNFRVCVHHSSYHRFSRENCTITRDMACCGSMTSVRKIKRALSSVDTVAHVDSMCREAS